VTRPRWRGYRGDVTTEHTPGRVENVLRQRAERAQQEAAPSISVSPSLMLIMLDSLQTLRASATET